MQEKKIKNTAWRLTLKLPQGKSSSQTFMVDLNSHSLLCQHTGSSGRANYCPLVYLGKSWFLNQAVLNRTCCWGSALPAGQGALRFELCHFHPREVCLSCCTVRWEHRTAADSQTGTEFSSCWGAQRHFGFGFTTSISKVRSQTWK